MKAIIPILFFSFLGLMPLTHAADNAYDIMVMEASTGKGKPATLAIDSNDKPGEIAFGKMKDDSFVGQRLIFRPLEIHTRRVEVVVEDVESPVADRESGTTTQQVHKKVITLEADGKSHTVDVNGKKLTFKVYAIGGVGDANKLMIEQDAP
ncbi:MAG: hypothetical protein J0M04_19110 [Verrucomicrobia bacterium]|nr:hypothetical protein [Verrucomicrobiota bacterium]